MRYEQQKKAELDAAIAGVQAAEKDALLYRLALRNALDQATRSEERLAQARERFGHAAEAMRRSADRNNVLYLGRGFADGG